MDGSLIINVGALATALAAVGTSSLLTTQALRLSRDANHMPVTLTLLAPHRTPEFVRKETLIWKEVGACDPALGFFQQPEPMRGHMIEIGLYYQSLSYVSEYGIADGEFIGVQTQYRLVRTWGVLEPFVKGERILRGGDYTFLNAYETFAGKARVMDVEATTKRLMRRGKGKRL